MKQHLSLLYLAARGTCYKVLLLLALMSGVQLGLFWRAMARAHDGGLGDPFDLLMRQCRAGLIFALAFVLLGALLCIGGARGGSHPAYSLRRMALSERSATLWQMGYNGLCFLLLWSVQACLMAFMLGRMAGTLWPPGQAGQAVLQIFYMDAFLHSLVPLGDVLRHVANALSLVALAATSACFPYQLRRRRRPMAFILMAAFCLLLFSRDMGQRGLDLFVCAVSLLATAYSLHLIWQEVPYEA